MQTPPAEFHRQLRSVFAILRTLVRQSSEGRVDVEDYVAHLEGRIGALARAHEMLMRAPPEGVDLQEMVCGEFLSQAIPDEQFKVDGPAIRVSREATAAIALAIHELTINAMTHGALARSGGRVIVSWSIQQRDGAHSLCFVWAEHGEAAAHPARRGFGWELFERMLPYELNARTTLESSNEGLRAQFWIPATATAPTWQLDTFDKK
jgi:two-component sensor histidine kinase